MSGTPDGKRLVIGIDLGTTHSLVAVVEGGRPRVLRNALGEVLTPSVVAFDGDEVLTGAAALAGATTDAGNTVRAFKRDMGVDKTYTLGERDFTPVELSACVLRGLKEDAEAVLGRAPDEAVISVPAYFNDLQRRATHQAAELAGLHVERLINEPTAAALAYGLHRLDPDEQDPGEEPGEHVVVLDLGGGTFDVTVLEIIEGVIEIQATAGDSQLGGEDFTAALAEHFAGQVEAEHRGEIDPASDSWARVVKACESAKKTLSREPVARLALSGLGVFSVSASGARGTGRACDVELEITREQAEQLWQPILERIRTPIRRALRDARLAPAAVDHVLAVGGASRMPCFVTLAEEIFEQSPQCDRVDEVVALGAALQAGLKVGDAALDDLLVTDVAPFTLGIEIVSEVGGQVVPGMFSPILERGTVIPASRVQTYSTVENMQPAIELKIYQGEHALCARNLRIGSLSITGLPPRPAGEEAIEVRFTYDLNGVLEVDVTVLSTGQTRDLVLEQTPGRLSAGELEQARAAMGKLKFHPRDALPNTTALARAEALYVELTGPSRQVLGQAIATFRGVLELQDAELIESSRDQVLNLVRSLKTY